MSALDTSSTGLQAFLSPRTVQDTVWPAVRQQVSALEPASARICRTNDVEDIWGDPTVTGKPVRSDIQRRNPTFPVLAALSTHNPAGGRLRRLWHADGTTAAQLREMADLVEESGGRRTAERLSRGHLDSALEHLGRAELSPAASTELTALFDRIVHRTA